MNILSYIIMVIAGLVILTNWIILIRWYTMKKRSTMILLVGGILGLIACMIHSSINWQWGLVALAVDPGCFSFLGIPNLIELFVKKLRGEKCQNK